MKKSFAETLEKHGSPVTYRFYHISIDDLTAQQYKEFDEMRIHDSFTVGKEEYFFQGRAFGDPDFEGFYIRKKIKQRECDA